MTDMSLYKTLPATLAIIIYGIKPEASTVSWLKYACYFTIPLSIVGIAWASSVISRFSFAIEKHKESGTLAKFAEEKADCFIIDVLLFMLVSLVPVLTDGEALESVYFLAIWMFTVAQAMLSLASMIGFSKVVERCEYIAELSNER